MNVDLQKAAVRRCASEITRCIWYYRAWKSLQYVERADTANFIRLSELALHDQMIAHAVKVLHRREQNGGGERTGLWALRSARGPEFDQICEQRSIDLDVIRKVGVGLGII